MKKIGSVMSLSLLVLFLLVGCVGFLEDSKVDYQLQERCGKKCEEFFKEKYGNGILNDGKTIVTYQNHYNKKLKKCFFLMSITIGTMDSFTIVEDLLSVMLKEIDVILKKNGFHL